MIVCVCDSWQAARNLPALVSGAHETRGQRQCAHAWRTAQALSTLWSRFAGDTEQEGRQHVVQTVAATLRRGGRQPPNTRLAASVLSSGMLARIAVAVAAPMAVLRPGDDLDRLTEVVTAVTCLTDLAAVLQPVDVRILRSSSSTPLVNCQILCVGRKVVPALTAHHSASTDTER